MNEVPAKASFDTGYAVLSKLEGGFWNDPSGGPTLAGVTQRAYDDWRRRHQLPTRAVAESTEAERRDLLQTGFWNVWRCAEMPEPWAIAVFCEVVNVWDEAIKIAQQALAWDGVYAGEIDGKIGAMTLAAMRKSPGSLETAALMMLGYYAGVSRTADEKGLRNRIRRAWTAIKGVTAG